MKTSAETNTWETHALMPRHIYAGCMYIEADPLPNFTIIQLSIQPGLMCMVSLDSYFLVDSYKMWSGAP